MRPFPLLLALACLLAACGTKGPLTLPPAKASPPSASVPATDDSNKAKAGAPQ